MNDMIPEVTMVTVEPDRLPVEGATPAKLRDFIQRIENIERERRELADDAKAVFAEAKAEGFDLPALREVLRLRRMKPAIRAERDDLVDTYRNAAGV